MKIYFWKRRVARLLVAAGLLMPSPLLAAPLGTNLVVNASFENVDVNDPGPFTGVRLQEWEDYDGNDDDTYSYPYSSNYAGVNTPPGAGDYHYTGGFNTAADEPQVTQRIDLSQGPSGSAIAAGTASYNLSAFFSTYLEQADSSRVRAVFLDASSNELDSGDIGGVEFLEGLGVTDGRKDWGQDSLVGSVPLGTKAVEIQIIADIGVQNHDGYVDLVDFRVAASLLGDYNGNGSLDTGDLDLQAVEINKPNPDLAKYDLNKDGAVSFGDRRMWVNDLKKTYVGDADLSGEFTSTDLVAVFVAGKYETGQAATWADGDFDGSQSFGSSDLVAAFVEGGYELGPRAAVTAVPEPVGYTLWLVGAAVGLPLARRFVRRRTIG